MFGQVTFAGSLGNVTDGLVEKDLHEFRGTVTGRYGKSQRYFGITPMALFLNGFVYLVASFRKPEEVLDG